MTNDTKTPVPAKGQEQQLKTDGHHSSIESALSEALACHGVTHLSILADGRFHRFDTPDKPKGKRNGWYKVHSPQAASFGIHHLDLTETVALYGSLDPQEAEHAKREALRLKYEQERQRQRQWEETAIKARSRWGTAKEADPRHPYLTRKRVSPHGLRQGGNTLLVPLYLEGELVNVERIHPDGARRTLPGGRVRGVASLIGHLAGAEEVLLVEGWSTGATLHEATGCPVVVARNADNLERVARRLRQRLPEGISVTVCGDDDRPLVARGLPNKGRVAARHAALSIGARLFMPTFCEGCTTCTDFNDVVRCRGGAYGD